MFTVCWSVKGGSGTTVVAASLAVLLASSSDDGALAIDLAGDLPAALGVADPGGPGIWDWLVAPPDVGGDALVALATQTGGVDIVPAGSRVGVVGALSGSPPSDAGSPPPARWSLLADVLASLGRPAVVDCGGPPPDELAGGAGASLVVVRSCYLGLRRAVGTVSGRATGAVLVKEPGRAIGRREVERVLGVPVVCEIAYDPAVARAVDAGLLCARLPSAVLSPLASMTRRVAA